MQNALVYWRSRKDYALVYAKDYDALGYMSKLVTPAHILPAELKSICIPCVHPHDGACNTPNFLDSDHTNRTLHRLLHATHLMPKSSNGHRARSVGVRRGELFINSRRIDSFKKNIFGHIFCNTYVTVSTERNLRRVSVATIAILCMVCVDRQQLKIILSLLSNPWSFSSSNPRL